MSNDDLPRNIIKVCQTWTSITTLLTGTILVKNIWTKIMTTWKRPCRKQKFWEKVGLSNSKRSRRILKCNEEVARLRSWCDMCRTLHALPISLWKGPPVESFGDANMLDFACFYKEIYCNGGVHHSIYSNWHPAEMKLCTHWRSLYGDQPSWCKGTMSIRLCQSALTNFPQEIIEL